MHKTIFCSSFATGYSGRHDSPTIEQQVNETLKWADQDNMEVVSIQYSTTASQNGYVTHHAMIHLRPTS